MKDFRKYSDKYSFRQRSETPAMAVELSLQPWRSFGTDGVIMFSDILTPLPAMGVDFSIVPGERRRSTVQCCTVQYSGV
jgi:uroporphyrinogen-III decarboxylase